MNLWDKIIAVVLACLAAMFSVILLALALGWDGVGPLLNLAAAIFNHLWPSIIAALLILAAAVRMLVFVYGQSEEPAIVKETPLGEVRIALHALEQLIQRTVRQMRGVRDAAAAVDATPAGIDIKITLTAISDNCLPDLAVEVQQNVEQCIQNATGMAVNDVKVKIKSVVGEVRPRVE